MDNAEEVALRFELTGALRKVTQLEGLIVWADRMARETRELGRTKGNNNALNLAAKGYKDARDKLGGGL
jgi:hypothetical protein